MSNGIIRYRHTLIPIYYKLLGQLYNILRIAYDGWGHKLTYKGIKNVFKQRKNSEENKKT